MSKKIYDVIIIGSGPAGLTAGVYIGRSGLSCLIIEKEAIGGKLVKTYEIENYPPFKNIKGVDLAIKMQEHAEHNNCIFKYEEVTKIINLKNNIKEVHTNKNIYKCCAILIASGTYERKLNIPGEDEYYSHGVSTCAVCDGSLYKNEIVAVVGGGNAATEEALYLTRFVNRVYLIHRRQQFRASASVVELIKQNSKIELILDTIVTKIIGEKNKVNKIQIQNVLNNEMQFLNVKCLFVYIGQIPNFQFVDEILNLDNTNHYVHVINDKCETNIPGIYAAGDIVKKFLQQIANAVGDGANAGQAIVNYVDIFKKKLKI